MLTSVASVQASASTPADEDRIHILIPIFNDWEVAALLIPRLDRVLTDHGLKADVLLVDDGSSLQPQLGAFVPTSAVTSLSILELRRNLGHQRAIAVGLTYLQQQLNPRA